MLEEAQAEGNPLLERVRFLAIVDSNLSEFFEVRVASLRQQVEAGITKRTPDGMTPAEQLAAIGGVVREQMAELYRCWNRELRPALEKEGIVFVVPEALEPVQQDWLRDLLRARDLPGADADRPRSRPIRSRSSRAGA